MEGFLQGTWTLDSIRDTLDPFPQVRPWWTHVQPLSGLQMCHLFSHYSNSLGISISRERFSYLKMADWMGSLVAQSVKRPTSARSRFRSPWVRAPRRALGWWLRAWSLFPILCLPLSLPLPRSCSVSVPKINKNVEKKIRKYNNCKYLCSQYWSP